MKYAMHLTAEELAELVRQAFGDRLEQIERSLLYLTDKKDHDFLKIDEVAAKLDVTTRTIHNWVKSKKLKCYWLGDRQFFLLKDVISAMKSNM